MKIIPAIDLLGGQCVRLHQGDYAQAVVYSQDPLEVAKRLEDHGLRYLHLVDLDGAKSQHIVHYRVLERIAARTALQIDFGGGIKSHDDLRIAFECGAAQITAGSIAVRNRALVLEWLERYGSEKIILGADARNGTIATQGWLEDSEQNAVDFIDRYVQEGVRYVVCTDIAKDGMLQGPALTWYGEILNRTPRVRLIASGGVSSVQDLLDLKDLGCHGAIVGKALYEGKITLQELSALC